jgi:hypothetical protein
VPDFACRLCGEPCGEDDFCFGCRSYVCSEHSDLSDFGSHLPEDHDDEQEDPD